MYKMRKCEKLFDVRFYSLRNASLFNFCLSCDPFFGQRRPNVVYIVNIGVGDGGHVPQKIREQIFLRAMIIKILVHIFRAKMYCPPKVDLGPTPMPVQLTILWCYSLEI